MLPFGAGFRRLELARVLALGIAAAGEEQAELAGLDHHRLAALVAGDGRIGSYPSLRLSISFVGALQVLLELLVEARERRLVVRLALLDLVEILFELARVVDVEDVVERRAEQLLDEHHAEHRRLEAAFDLVHVVARLDHADDRRVGARPADAVLFERLDQRRFAVARRRLRELLLRLQLLAARADRLPRAAAARPCRRRLPQLARVRAGPCRSAARLGRGRPGCRPPASRRTSAPIP